MQEHAVQQDGRGAGEVRAPVPARAGLPGLHRYRFTSDWDGPATLYIQETVAGRAQYRTPRAAMDALEHILNERAHEAHRREFYARLRGRKGI